jgi:transposase
MDTSKHIFQLHGASAVEAPVLRKKLRRKELVEFCAKLTPTEIAIEACGAPIIGRGCCNRLGIG